MRTPLLVIWTWARLVWLGLIAVSLSPVARATEKDTVQNNTAQSDAQQDGAAQPVVDDRVPFDVTDFVLTLRYHGPANDKLFAATAVSERYRVIIDKRASEPRQIAFVATAAQIRNWRSALDPPPDGVVLKTGVFQPAAGFTGYVVEVETAGKAYHWSLGWRLETFDALCLLQSCCWETRPDAFTPLLDALADTRRAWAEERYRPLLGHDWHRLVISTGSGSCWGSHTSPRLEVVRSFAAVSFRSLKQGEVAGRAVADPSQQLASFQAELFKYAVHLEQHGRRPGNAYKIYKIELQAKPDAELKTVFYGCEAHFNPLGGKHFDRWVEEMLKGP